MDNMMDRDARMDAILVIDQLMEVWNRCPKDERFRCGGTLQQPKRSCIVCWLDYLWYNANDRDPALMPRNGRLANL